MSYDAKKAAYQEVTILGSMALTVWKLADSTISQQKVCQERLFDFCHCGILDASKNEEVRHAADIYRY